MKKKFAEEPTSQVTKYKYEGYTQSKRKVEFKKAGDAVAKKRGISAYNPMVHMGGIPLGQRQLMSYQVSGTDVVVEGDDLHFVNNAAMQQFWDEIRRTVIVGLDTAHSVLEKRLGKTVTPETISNYLAVLNHAMPGGAVVQEHMVETHPGVVDDCFVKVFTGDDELADSIDKQYVIDINKAFPKEQAEQIKKSLGKSLHQAVHIPTIVVRTCDGGTTSRWSAMQIGMSFITAYKMCAGEAAVADLAFAAKHASVVEMGNLLPARRARGPNEPGGVSFGFLSDIVQTGRKYPDDPIKSGLEVVASGCMLYDQIWLGSYMSGGVGFTQYATAAYTDDILDDFSYYGADYVKKKYGGACKAKANLDTVNDVGTEVTLYGIEQYEGFPTTLEDHFGGSQRATVLSAASGLATSYATGNGNAGLSAWYLSMYLHKEAWGRLGFFGYDLQDQCGATNVFSCRSDEGAVAELRGPNYPNYAMNVGHQGGYAGIAAEAHFARGDAWTVSPLLKVAFADKDLKFDFTEPRKEFARGAIREFMPAGERSLIIPAK
nr:coenzyme-B sulfoethylthiotransferase subunit alpha [Methanocella sp. CWC-04]